MNRATEERRKKRDRDLPALQPHPIFVLRAYMGRGWM